MQLSLVEDSRYVLNCNHTFSEEGAEKMMLRYNSLISDKVVRQCMEKIVSDHQDSVFEACKIHQCGKDIGSGCSHIAGYSISTEVTQGH